MREKFRLSVTLEVLLLYFLGSVFYFLSHTFISSAADFFIQTTLEIIFIIRQIYRVRQNHPELWFINPTVLCSIMTFILSYGITNVIYLLPADYLQFAGISGYISKYMDQEMYLTNFAVGAMWLGYWSKLADIILNSKRVFFYKKKYFSYDSPPKYWVLPMLMGVVLLSNIVSIRLGVYGYASSYQSYVAAASYTQYLFMATSCGFLALLVATLCYYRNNPSILDMVYFYVILVIELFFGVISGMKINVILPLLIVVIGKSFKENKLSLKWLIISIVGMKLAFAVIVPFRAARNNTPNFYIPTVSGLTRFFIHSFLFDGGGDKDLLIPTKTPQIYYNARTGEVILPAWLEFFTRINIVEAGAYGIEYINKYEHLPSGSPDFFTNMFLALPYAFVPRFLWKDKPLSDVGLWYTQKIMDLPESYSSTAMGIVTNLFLTGGTFMVFVGFFLIGLFQRLIFFITQGWKSSAGVLVYIGICSSITLISEHDFTFGILIDIFRNIPILLILQYFLYTRKPFLDRV